jgi:hypothetical protein
MMTFSPEQLATLQLALVPAVTGESARDPARDPAGLSGTCLPLWPVPVAYLAFVCLLGGVSLLAPVWLLAVALVGSPGLLVPLGVHALAIPHTHAPCQPLALACALLYPLSVWLAHPWLLWLSALSLSCFFALAAPKGVLGRASAWSCCLVLLAGGLILARAPGRFVWPALVLALALQSVAATARLRNAGLACAVVDVSARAPSSA